MASLNRVIVMGNLGKDPEIRKAGDRSVANFSIATSERWTDKMDGSTKERTEWHRIVVWGKQAENCGKYLRKGASALVEGRLQTREYADPKDATQKRYITEIIADHVTFCGGGKASEGVEPTSKAGSAPVADDDIPF